MSKIRVLIYRLGTYNLRIKVVSFPDQEKLLKKVVFSLAVSINANTEYSQIKHCPCPKYVVKFTICTTYRPENTSEI